MTISSAGYQELLEEEDLHPMTRASFEQGLRTAIRRESLAEKLGEEGRRKALIYNRQQEAVREMRFLCGLQFEAVAWRRRSAVPVRGPLLDSVEESCQHKQRDIAKRLQRARSEADRGCEMQVQWLKDHAELIAAVESYQRPRCSWEKETPQA